VGAHHRDLSATAQNLRPAAYVGGGPNWPTLTFDSIRPCALVASAFSRSSMSARSPQNAARCARRSAVVPPGEVSSSTLGLPSLTTEIPFVLRKNLSFRAKPGQVGTASSVPTRGRQDYESSIADTRAAFIKNRQRADSSHRTGREQNSRAFDKAESQASPSPGLGPCNDVFLFSASLLRTCRYVGSSHDQRGIGRRPIRPSPTPFVPAVARGLRANCRSEPTT